MQLPNFPKWRASASAFVLVALVGLQGCVFTPKAEDGRELTPKQGLLVLKISSNVDARLGFMDFKNESSFGIRFAEDLIGPTGFVFGKKDEEKYVVIPLDAGDYMWSKIEVYPKYAPLHASNKFTVVANSINYIGDVRIYSQDSSFSMRVVDREEAMRDYMSSKYPEYLKNMPVVKTLAEMRL
ncbi:MAG: hypothetical protein V4857_03740 [Pseudomonadota bacterium]